MRILLVNDDGVYSAGLQTLRATLERARGVELYVVAPDRPRSASGHAITLHKPLYLERVHVAHAASPIYAVNGTPADCTKIGLLEVLPGPADLVIAGINRGGNLGIDVIYSGTVSAAIEAVILGVPSIAVSLAGWENLDYRVAADFTAHLVSLVQRHGLPAGTLLNVNVPHLDWSELAGVAITSLGRRSYRDRFEHRTDPRGRRYYWLAGEPVVESPAAGTDVGAVRAGLISITPLSLRLVDPAGLEQLRPWQSDLQAVLERRRAAHGTPGLEEQSEAMVSEAGDPAPQDP